MPSTLGNMRNKLGLVPSKPVPSALRRLLLLAYFSSPHAVARSVGRVITQTLKSVQVLQTSIQ